MPEAKEGDTVEVSYKGTVENVHPWMIGDVHVGTRYRVKRSDGFTSNFGVRADSAITVEVIDSTYVHGGVYKDADGDVFRYDSDEDGWLDFGTDFVYSLSYPSPPLVRIDN